ncbi:MAG: AraC-like DNA-binding protein [Psychromonas sp.]|jgi:AraC-like DNA-binding protein|uniref:helix-turn-helix domain-containing protein n=1 Tax=Psychromonas sp. TaxID=1884585 RepID=UPI0039E53548
MFNRDGKNLLLIAFDPILSQRCIKQLSPFFDVDYCDSMELLEKSKGNPGAVIYLMDFTRADHLYNLNYIRNKYPEKCFFVITATVSIPLLHHSLHIGVDDLFIFPLSNQDQHQLFCIIKNTTSVQLLKGAIESNIDLFYSNLMDNNPLNSVLEIIERDFSKSPSLLDLSKKVYLSPSRVSHLFKDSCGITYSYYLLFRKLEEGERLLTMGNISISSVSYQIGFANPSHFCRSFKEHFNITPTSYAEGNRGIEQSDAYLQYQRIRSELFPVSAVKSDSQGLSLGAKRHVV